MKKNNGFTLVEVLLTLGIMVITTGIFISGFKMINSLFRHQSLIEVQRGGQVFLYQLTQEIRNADKIIEINGMTAGPEKVESLDIKKDLDLTAQSLTIRSFDYSNPDITSLGNENLFKVEKTIFIQYTYDIDSKAILRRVFGVTKDGEIDLTNMMNEKRFLMGLIVPDKNQNRLFQPLGSLAQLPFQAVTIVFRLIPSWANSTPRIYSAEAMIRGR